MSNYLIVVDMQNDFIDGALGSPAAEAIVEGVCREISDFSGRVILTRDTHEENYLDTREGRLLPVPHCIRGTEGWEINARVAQAASGAAVIDKPTFGSYGLIKLLTEENAREMIESVTLIGLCTDICVISCAMLVKAAFPEAEVGVKADLCAGVTEESHRNALSAMAACQINIL